MSKPKFELIGKNLKVSEQLTFTGSNMTLRFDGDKPVNGLSINLGDGADVTFQNVVDGVDHKILDAAGNELSLDMNTNTETYRFFPEFAGVQDLKIQTDVNQTTTSAIVRTFETS